MDTAIRKFNMSGVSLERQSDFHLAIAKKATLTYIRRHSDAKNNLLLIGIRETSAVEILDACVVVVSFHSSL